MAIRIMIESEWGLYPLNVDVNEGLYTPIHPDYFREMFDVPEFVMNALDCWDELFQDVIDWDDPGGSDWKNPALRAAYVEKGREVMKLLRRHIPAEVTIEYCADGSLASEFY